MGSEEQPDEVNDARKLTVSGVELATKKAASNRVREGGLNDCLAMDTDFYQRDVYDEYTSS